MSTEYNTVAAHHSQFDTLLTVIDQIIVEKANVYQKVADGLILDYNTKHSVTKRKFLWSKFFKFVPVETIDELADRLDDVRMCGGYIFWSNYDRLPEIRRFAYDFVELRNRVALAKLVKARFVDIPNIRILDKRLRDYSLSKATPPNAPYPA